MTRVIARPAADAPPVAAIPSVNEAAIPLLQQTIAALSVFDADRLESLAFETEAFAERYRAARAGDLNRCEQFDEDAKKSQEKAGTIHARALKNTLCELLRTTDANLRLLRQLRDMRVTGLAIDDYSSAAGGPRWVR